MRNVLKHGLIAIATLFIGAVVPATAAAHNGVDHSANPEATHEETHERLGADKLKVCKVKQRNIAATMERSVARVERQLNLFGTIAERVEGFYSREGEQLSNYAQLVAAANTARLQVQDDLEGLKSHTFDCENDPKGTVAGFREHLEMTRTDLAAYRTAVKDLIAGVKSGQGGVQ